MNIMKKYLQKYLRGNITIVYEHTVCAMSAFSMCMLRASFNVVHMRSLGDTAKIHTFSRFEKWQGS